MRKAELIKNINQMRTGQIRRYKNIGGYIKNTRAGTDNITREIFNRQVNFSADTKNLTPAKLKKLTVKELKQTYKNLGHQTGQLRQSGYLNRKTGKYVPRSIKTKLKSKELEDLEINKAANDAQLGEDEFQEELDYYIQQKEDYEKGKLTKEEFKKAQERMSEAAQTANAGGNLGGNLDSAQGTALFKKLNKNGLNNVTIKTKISDQIKDLKYMKKNEVQKYTRNAAAKGNFSYNELTKLGKATLQSKNPKLTNKDIVNNAVSDRISRYDFMNVNERKRALESYQTVKKGLREGLNRGKLNSQTKSLMRQNLRVTNQILKGIKRIFG